VLTIELQRSVTLHKPTDMMYCHVYFHTFGVCRTPDSTHHAYDNRLQ